MTGPAALVCRRAYDVHGIAIDVTCNDPAVLDTVDQRLNGFRRARPPSPGGAPALRIDVTREGVDAPTGASRPVYDTPYGQLFYFSEDDVLYGELAGVALRCAAGDGSARISAAAFTGRDVYLATHPLLTISLMELLERRGRYSLHAACLARAGRGVLLAGPSGAGKSTLALALAGAGLAFLSDDIVFLAHRPGGDVRVLGFADALGMTEGSVARFPDLRPALQQAPVDGFPKRLVRVEHALPETVLEMSCEPRALLFRPSRRTCRVS